MRMIKCDGCGKVENFVDRKMPYGFAEVTVTITAGPDVPGGFHMRYDLCGSCQGQLKDYARVSEWPRAPKREANKYELGALYKLPEGNGTAFDESSLPTTGPRS